MIKSLFVAVLMAGGIGGAYLWGRGNLNGINTWLDQSGKSSFVSIENESEGNTSYSLEFEGTFEEINLSESTMKLSDDKKNNIIFAVPKYMIAEGDVSVMGLVRGERIKVRWDDKNSLEEAWQKYRDNPKEPVNMRDASIFFEKVGE